MVNVHQVFVSLKGDYKWQSYNSDLPPHRANSISRKPFVRFISCTILDTLATGALSVWGEVSEVTISFVWKSPDFIYHSIGLLALRYFCMVSIPCSLYIDECRGELKLPLQTPVIKPSLFWLKFCNNASEDDSKSFQYTWRKSSKYQQVPRIVCLGSVSFKLHITPPKKFGKWKI